LYHRRVAPMVQTPWFYLWSNPPRLAAGGSLLWSSPPRLAAGGSLLWSNPPRLAAGGSLLWSSPPRLAAGGSLLWSSPPRLAAGGSLLWSSPPRLAAGGKSAVPGGFSSRSLRRRPMACLPQTPPLRRCRRAWLWPAIHGGRLYPPLRGLPPTAPGLALGHPLRSASGAGSVHRAPRPLIPRPSRALYAGRALFPLRHPRSRAPAAPHPRGRIAPGEQSGGEAGWGRNAAFTGETGG
jgi:hypothetical protein